MELKAIIRVLLMAHSQKPGTDFLHDHMARQKRLRRISSSLLVQRTMLPYLACDHVTISHCSPEIAKSRTAHQYQIFRAQDLVQTAVSNPKKEHLMRDVTHVNLVVVN